MPDRSESRVDRQHRLHVRCREDFDAARKDDDVLAEEQRVDQSLMNQISQERRLRHQGTLQQAPSTVI